MSYFEYAAVFYGIVVGLAISNILTSVHKLVEAGARVRWHWMAPATALNATILTLGNFWGWWILRSANFGARTFLNFLPTVIALSLLFLACGATLPDEVPEDGVDLRTYYFSNIRRFWSFYAATFALNIFTWLIVFARTHFEMPIMRIYSPVVMFNLTGLILASVTIFVRAPWWHWISIIGGFVFLILFMGQLYLS